MDKFFLEVLSGKIKSVNFKDTQAIQVKASGFYRFEPDLVSALKFHIQ